MFVRRLALLASTALVLSAGVAQAQSATSLSVSGENLIGNSFSAAPVMAAGGGSGSSSLSPRVFAGLINGGGSTAFLVGGGVSTVLSQDGHHGVQGNLGYSRKYEINTIAIDLDYVYNFLDVQAGDWTPYAGAGLNILHDAGDFGGTDSALQIGGGVKKGSFFGELWFAFHTVNITVVRVGLNF
jgi:hypothetical protein